jgi:23S rRNA (adenine2503-C2)-methyltransferase
VVSNFKCYPLSEAKRVLVDLGYDAYRGEQIFKWIWQRNVRSFSAMTNISKDLRDRLSGIYTIDGLHPVRVSREADSTHKYLFELEDGRYVESVYIRESRRRTVCVSCQVGCPLGCKFCVTALMGFERSLLAYEIADQVRSVQEAVGEKCTNVVFMGMGEPFLNIDEIFKTLDIMSYSGGLAISRRHTTISTAGLIQGMESLLRSPYRVKLAISLNFADEEKRKEFMPVALGNPLRELLRVAKAYSVRKEMVTFEYVMLRGINDGLNDAKQLRRLVSGIPAKINLIPFNEHPMLKYKRPTERRLNAFYNCLLESKHTVVIRKSRGQEIHAGCGQLAGSLSLK